ncbi:hypothetical protein JTE90_005284 [Oedothorax gibbosus]|uniref:Uncharacterized protein n=1 Tax=Oedothorax gibbosus TaxID=931172 RepID=A0AAV6U1R9_9ARAC|nr:hypothetical protein JTE90_005284 [Oedothorax gibbosus]
MKAKPTLSLILLLLLNCHFLSTTDAFHMFGGDDDGGELAEILAAGLVTKMLMEDLGGLGGGNNGGGGGGRAANVFQTLRNQVTSRFNPPAASHTLQPMIAPPPRPAYQPMMATHPRPHIIHPMYPMPPPHIIHHHRQQQYMMALMQQAHQQALATAWNNQYRAQLQQGSESVARSSPFPSFLPIGELLSDEDTLSVVTILLNSDLLDDGEDDEQEQKEVIASKEVEEVEKPKTDEEEQPEFEASASEGESRYILPRIVSHFVQRIMRRMEHQ